MSRSEELGTLISLSVGSWFSWQLGSKMSMWTVSSSAQVLNTTSWKTSVDYHWWKTKAVMCTLAIRSLTKIIQLNNNSFIISTAWNKMLVWTILTSTKVLTTTGSGPLVVEDEGSDVYTCYSLRTHRAKPNVPKETSVRSNLQLCC